MALSATPKIIFFCPWFDNFTHFCLEAYPRLYAAIKELESSNKEYFVVVPPKRREFDTKDLYQSFINPILLSLNITEDKRIYTNTYNKLNSPGFIMLNNVYLPSHVKWNETYIMNAINHLKNYYYDENFKWEYENIYISRKNASRRKIVNEDEVIAYLAKYNFKSIEMEDLSFKERINILMRAKRMIGIDGTNLTGMIFMPEDSSCVALRCYDMQEFNYFSASVARINFYVIVCEIANKIPNIHGEYWFFSDLVVDINILESKLKEYGVL